MNTDYEIIYKNYFVRNTFICNIDEYKEHPLRKNKSLSDLFSLQNLLLKNNDIHKIWITETQNNLCEYIYNYLIKDIDREIVKFKLDNSTKLENDNKNFNTIFDKVNLEYEFFNTITNLIDTNSNNNNNYKQIIKMLKELLSKLNEIANASIKDNELNKYNPVLLILNCSIINLELIYENLNIKKTNKIKDQYILKIEINKISKNIIKLFIDENIKYKTNIIQEIDKIRNDYKKLCKLIDNQYNKFIKDLKLKLKNFVNNEWKNIIKTKKFLLDVNENLKIGNKDHNIQLKINFNNTYLFIKY